MKFGSIIVPLSFGFAPQKNLFENHVVRDVRKTADVKMEIKQLKAEILENAKSKIVETTAKEIRKPQDLHHKFIKRLSPAEKQKWIDKIWTSNSVESHAEEEPIEILAWYEEHGRVKREISLYREGSMGRTKEGRHVKDRKISLDGSQGRQSNKPLTDRHCGPCTITTDRSKEKTADAILIDNGPLHLWQLHGHFKGEENYAHPFPEIDNRNHSQFWVFQNRESAIKCSIQPSIIDPKIDETFNLTLTYRQDSDVTRHVADIEQLITNDRFDPKTGDLEKTDKQYFTDLLENKFSANGDVNTGWYVSNCNHTVGATERLVYGQSLIDAGLKLHTEGACFGNVTERQFGRNAERTGFPNSKLKFYLSFENAFHCNDYISEKFWRNALGEGLVPIVYGPHEDDVKAVAPPNSYIHAEWFTSPAELVNYINFLDKNNEAYLDYHQWRTLYPKGISRTPYENIQFLGSDDRALCDLCRVIREKRRKNSRQNYKSIMHYWQFDVYPECKASKQFQLYQTTIKNNLRNL